MPKQVWPRKNEAVLEPEVVMYAFIAFSALFPTAQSRKRGRDAAEPVNLAAHPNVSKFFGTQPAYWVDIASAMSTHPLTKELPHLHSPTGLNSWFAKYRPNMKVSNAFRDAHCSQRWKAYLVCEEKRAVLEVHLQRAVERRNNQADETINTETPPTNIAASSLAPADPSHDFSPEVRQEVALMAGNGDGKKVFSMLYDIDNDENLTHFNPGSILDVVKEHCNHLYVSVEAVVTGPNDLRNTVKTPMFKVLQGCLKLAELVRVRSKRAVPVFAFFMAIVYFSTATNRTLMDGRNSEGVALRSQP